MLKKKISVAFNHYKSLSKTVKASIWFLICGFLQRGISVITTPIFTRLLTTEEYGIYSVFSSWLEILTIFVTLKLGAGVLMQGLVKRDKNRETFSSSLLGLATTTTFIWFIIYLIFNEYFNKLFGLSTLLMICMFIMMISTVAYNFWSANQRVEFEYKNLIIVSILVSILKPLIGIIAIILFPVYKAESRIVSLALIELFSYFWMYIKLMKSGKVFYCKENWKYALNFNIPLIPHYLSQTILNHSDRIMINTLVNVSSAGIYSLAYNISSIMSLFNTSLNNTLNPWIYKKIKENKIKQIGKVSYFLLIVIAVLNLMFIAAAPEIVSIFAPSSYHEAIWVIPPVSMAVYFKFTYCLFADFEFYYEKTRWVMIASLSGAILNILLNYIFIPKYGYIAAAYTTLVCYIVYSIMHYIFMKISCKKYANNEQPYELRYLLSISIIFLLFGFVLMIFYKLIYLRYCFFAICLILIVLYRNKITGKLKELRKGGKNRI